jgi:hypothetical protein
VNGVEVDLNRREKKEPFLWIRERSDLENRLRKGELVIERRSDRNDPDDAMIHDWTGAVLIRGAKLGEVASILTDYNRHNKIYPEVLEGRTIERQGDRFKAYLKLRKRQVITVVLNSEYQGRIWQPSPTRWRMNSYSTRISEVDDPGTKDEKELPPDAGHGYLWRLNAFWSLEQTDEGVWVECRAVSLSRDVPFGLGRIIGPFIQTVPRESLENTLESTRRVATGQSPDRAAR